MRKLLTVGVIFLGAICGSIGYWLGASQPGAYLREGLQWQFSEAAGRGDLASLEKLRAQGAQVNAIPGDDGVRGYPALLMASMKGEAKAVKWLIEIGANVNAVSGPGDTALSVAEDHLKGAQEAVEILKSHGAKRSP